MISVETRLGAMIEIAREKRDPAKAAVDEMAGSLVTGMFLRHSDVEIYRVAGKFEGFDRPAGLQRVRSCPESAVW